jgi:serine/threonine-protein kinase
MNADAARSGLRARRRMLVSTAAMHAPPPTTFGPYRLLRPIGRGSMGAVHLAVDGRDGRPAAVKCMPLDPHGEGAEQTLLRQRFLAEVAAARRLTHPDIVAVHDAGEQHGHAWLAMELLPGCDLGRYTHMSRLLPEPLVLQLVERLARALAHAHAQGVVHRDIKPGNVMLHLPTRRLKLTDFGVAGLADLSRTRTGVVLGTPYYMAPEQLAGAGADARSDLYALGVLLYQLLTGRLPHEHASLGELLRAVASEPAPDVRVLRPALSAALAGLVAQALEKQPARRPASSAEFADALAALSGLRTGAKSSASRPDAPAQPRASP